MLRIHYLLRDKFVGIKTSFSKSENLFVCLTAGHKQDFDFANSKTFKHRDD